MKDKVYNLPNASKKYLDQLKRIAPDVNKECETLAEIRYANYLAHIKAGFTEKQALALCTKFGFSP